MTELEALIQKTRQKISECETFQCTIEITKDALITAYNLGRALTPAQLAARKRNAQKAGRKAGSRDSQPRVRRTRAQIEASKAKEMKP